MHQHCAPCTLGHAVYFLSQSPPIHGKLVQNANENGLCGVAIGDTVHMIPYAAIQSIDGCLCPEDTRTTELDVAVAAVPLEVTGPRGILTYMASLAASGAKLKSAVNVYQAEGLEDINGVAFNLGLVSSIRLLTEVYLMITSVRYPQAVRWNLSWPQPQSRPVLGQIAAATKERMDTLTGRDGQWQPGLRFLEIPVATNDHTTWHPKDLRHLLSVVLVHLYITDGHRIQAAGGKRMVLVNPANRVLFEFRSYLGLSNAGLTDQQEQIRPSHVESNKILAGLDL